MESITAKAKGLLENVTMNTWPIYNTIGVLNQVWILMFKNNMVHPINQSQFVDESSLELDREEIIGRL